MKVSPKLDLLSLLSYVLYWNLSFNIGTCEQIDEEVSKEPKKAPYFKQKNNEVVDFEAENNPQDIFLKNATENSEDNEHDIIW